MGSQGQLVSRAKITLKATPEVRKAFDELISKEGFLHSSEVILKYVSSLLEPAEEELEELPEDVVYVIKRLITSLASQRMLIRQGSYTILQVMLQLHPNVLPFTVGFIENFYSNKNAHSNESMSDFTLGHTLALGAVIRSDCAMEKVSDVQNIIKNLLNFKDKRFSLDPIAGQFLVDLILMYKENNVSQIMWKEAKDILEVEMENLSPSSLRLRMILARSEYFKALSDVDQDFQSKTFDKSTYVFVLSVFKKLFQEHVNITPMLEDYFQSLLLYTETCDGEENLVTFFSEAVTPSLDKAVLKNNVFIFNITQVALSHLKSKKCIEALLSSELMEMLLQSSISKIDEVNASARGLMSAILQLLIRNKESGPKFQLTILKGLTSTSAKLNLDSVTKTTILQQAFEHLSLDAIVEFAKVLNKQLESFYADENLEQSKKFPDLLACCQWLSKLICHSSMMGFEHHAWKAEEVSQLFKFFFLKKLSSKQQLQIKDCYLRALNQSSSNIEWQALFVESIVERVRALLESDDSDCLSSKDKDLFLRTSQGMKELKTNDLTASDLQVFKILYGYISLHIFIDSTNSEELIEEISQCFKKAAKTKKKNGKKKSLIGGREEEPHWVEVLVEVLLSLISKVENFWRKIVCTIFKHICHSVNPASLSILTDILNPDKDDIILEADDEEDDISMEEDVEDEIMEEGEEEEEDVEDETDDDEDDDDDEEDDDDESDDDDSDDEDTEVDEEDVNEENILNLKRKMQSLVGLPMEMVEIDSVPEEEFVNIDKQLGTLVGKYISLKKSKKLKRVKLDKDETALMCFRTRVCDLLETLIREAPSLNHILAIIKPIMSAISKAYENNLQKQLLDKLKSLIPEIVKVKKFSKPASISAVELAAYLKDFFEFSTKLSNKLKPEISSCCLFLVRSGLHLTADENEADSNTMMEAYSNHLEAGLKETNIDIYDGPIHLETGAVKIVLKKLLETVFKKSIRPFKKKKGIEMIKQILSSEKALRKIPTVELSSLLQILKKEIISAFDYVKQPKQVQSNYLMLVLDMLKTLKKVLKSNPELDQEFDWKDVTNSLTQLTDRVPLGDFKALKKLIVSMCNIIGMDIKRLENIASKSPKVAENESSLLEKSSNSISDSKKSRKKKRKNSKHMETEDTPAPVHPAVDISDEETTEEVPVTPEEKNKKRKKDAKTKSNKKQKQNENEEEKEENSLNKGEDKEESVETLKPKKKNKKKQKNYNERRKKNDARLWLKEEITGFCFADVKEVNLD